MVSLRGRVIRGRLVVDEPVDLPDGTVVELEVVSANDEPSEVARVHAALDEALQDLEAGDEGEDAVAFIRELRAKR